ncbi:MAG: 3-keto-5-aminohexanoate cleavage protein [Candidatus Binatia bacterium]
MSREPVIIEAALNGVTPKAVNPKVPLAPGEIADEAIQCLEAGAAIIHSHNAEYAVDGARAAELYLEAWRPVLRARPDAILYPTIGFGPRIEERYAHFPVLAEVGAIRMGLLDPGSVNLGGADEEGLPAPVDVVYVNSYRDIRHEAAECERLRLGPSTSIFEPGFLRIALAFHRAGRMPPGALVKLYFGGDRGYLGERNSGVTFGLPPTRLALEVYLEMLEGCGLPWAVAVIGGDVVESGMARWALERGGHVRVGLEDFGGSRTPANEELVREVAALAREVGRPVASCEDAARILGLPR